MWLPWLVVGAVFYFVGGLAYMVGVFLVGFVALYLLRRSVSRRRRVSPA